MGRSIGSCGAAIEFSRFPHRPLVDFKYRVLPLLDYARGQMSLTQQGYRDRFWQGYPALRQFLQRGDGVPHGVDLLQLVDREELRTSIDHGPLGRLADIVAIARLLVNQAGEVHEAMRREPSSEAQIAAEVRHLLKELEYRTDHFRHAMVAALDRELEAARKAVSDVDEFSWRLRHERDAQEGTGPSGSK